MWRALTRDVEHRPWPMPRAPWVMTMAWRDLLFAHWRVDAEVLAAHLPPGLELERFDGSAWLGLVPFTMDDVGARGLPYMPGTRRFPELNVRTYVVRDGLPGVFFLSLDAANPLAVRGARAFFHLPYFHARMSSRREGELVHYASERRDPRLEAGVLDASYRPVPGAGCDSELERWLTERYCLYAADPRGRLFRGEVHHRPWPLQRAEAELRHNSVALAHGFELREPPELLHYVERIDVLGWAPVRIRGLVPRPPGAGRRPSTAPPGR